jgi:hypothetical protein
LEKQSHNLSRKGITLFHHWRPIMINRIPQAALLAVIASAIAAATPASATVFRFDTAPFAGTNVLATPGRQFVGNELFIPSFDFANDVISIDPTAFGIAPTVNFYSGLAANLPAGGANFIILLDVDADGIAANGILNNAALSANLIAAQITTPTPGFFQYFNSNLNLNRLVFSPDLSSAASDLKIVARFTGATGLAAADALPRFKAANFAVAVPEPSTWAMLIGGFGLVGSAMRRRTATVVAA